jgi:hypothetical protein
MPVTAKDLRGALQYSLNNMAQYHDFYSVRHMGKHG